ncbi:MAG: NAD(P)/FAD-dependent oxidoreductase, partial [Alphaproteobacteria bacterium]|nr:NAD(P)/FAD-dependent oxidoreductase [Alphaproteobacteria bacterium]
GPIRGILRRHSSARVLLDAVTGIDTAGRRVLLADGAPLDYDYLVLATGARHSYFGNDAWAAHAPGLKTIDDATTLRGRILVAMERAETCTDKAERDRLLTFVVVGGGPTGVEMAGAIAELTRHAVGMDFHHITPQCSRIVLIEAGTRLLAAFPESLSAKAKASLEALGVEVRLAARVEHIGPDGVTVGGALLPSACVTWAAGVQASPAAAWLGATADRSGRVEVGPDLGVRGAPGVFVIGDTAAVVSEGRPVPGIAPAAKQMGCYVAGVIAARIAGRAPPGPFRYRHRGSLATIGRQRAVIDFGRLQLSGLVAWLLWSTVHVYFLVGFRNRFVVGASWLWNYLTFDRGARLITGVRISDAPGLAVARKDAA